MAKTRDISVVLKQAATPQVAEDIVGLDLVGGVVAPGLRVTDSYIERGELGLQLRLWSRDSSTARLQSASESGNDVRNHGFDLGLGFG